MESERLRQTKNQKNVQNKLLIWGKSKKKLLRGFSNEPSCMCGYIQSYELKKKKLIHSTTTITNNSLHHQNVWGQHNCASSSSIPIYSKPHSYSLPRSSLSLKSLLTTYSQPIWVQPAVLLTLDGSPTMDDLSSFICQTYPSHLSLSPITALESRTGLHFSYSLLLKIRSVRWVPKTVRR